MALYSQVDYVDGRQVIVRIGPKSQVHFERKFNITIFEYGRRRSYEQLLWLSWHALSECKQETRDFEEFLEVIDDAVHKLDTPEDPVDDRAVNPLPDPSRKAQPAATSSS